MPFKEDPLKTVKIVLAAVFGTIALVLIVVAAVVIYRRAHEKYLTNLDELQRLEVVNYQNRFKIQMLEQKIFTEKNIYTTFESQLGMSSIYDVEPIYEQIPLGINKNFVKSSDYNHGQNIWDFRENPWNFETTRDLLSTITSLRMEEFQWASFNIDLRLFVS